MGFPYKNGNWENRDLPGRGIKDNVEGRKSIKGIGDSKKSWAKHMGLRIYGVSF